ncbi:MULTISPECIES: tetratricopeptide repeat protein [Burkholderia]|jgi:TPR repeat protein|uniref:Sel1 repeat family protein n=1 Tax=Burkholderia contaminans TaxID=488447 RepID=A0A250L951_9BURK|nr:tetratricopeptide repeat protein [Burkholderia contaminans]UTP24477.1 sel1 repeat family protein [Burkholderia sp. FXe9]MCA7911244.1 sel1 repeat family protein [Burkholderia contaminans]MCA8191298.1 sel1 repeat family protein [Burkholderia contaminans]MCA8367644.1 sel1 repeat family protein [Burkholderia contaminans]MCQ4560451.1 sel1 repeat family protein [Burkholderia contaminans]
MSLLAYEVLCVLGDVLGIASLISGMMPIPVIYRAIFSTLALITVSVHAEGWPSSTAQSSAGLADLPRYEKLPRFDPHRKSFTCVHQDQHVPRIDPQAELWFQQALALDNPDVYYEKRDYPKIYQLYIQAADRGHWKAMLNLASLILSDYPGVPRHDPEAAIVWVEKAMQLGVPDAFDMMGTYHENGLVKGGDATSAYAFFQRAADMGSPSAQTFLGFKMSGSYDSPDGEFWGNATIGMEMLQCALAQGYGDAAYDLGGLYKGATPESKLRALKVLHEGVKLGCAKCAKDLASEFRGFDLTSGNNLVGHVDTARADRYLRLGEALEHAKGRLKLPNLDKILPLPPAPLPKWDGNAKTLIDTVSIANRQT